MRGFKQSGIGREGLSTSLLELVQEQKHRRSGGRVFGPRVSGFHGARIVISSLIGAGVVRSVPFGSSQGGDGWRLKRGYSVASVGASRSPTSGTFTKPVSWRSI